MIYFSPDLLWLHDCCCCFCFHLSRSLAYKLQIFVVAAAAAAVAVLFWLSWTRCEWHACVSSVWTWNSNSSQQFRVCENEKTKKKLKLDSLNLCLSFSFWWRRCLISFSSAFIVRFVFHFVQQGIRCCCCCCVPSRIPWMQCGPILSTEVIVDYSCVWLYRDRKHILFFSRCPNSFRLDAS